MALDCSRGKQICLAWRKNILIFSKFSAYIYIRSCPLLGDLYFFLLVIQINLKNFDGWSVQ